MGLEVLMIRTGEMMYEANLNASKKTSVAQTHRVEMTWIGPIQTEIIWIANYNEMNY